MKNNEYSRRIRNTREWRKISKKKRWDYNYCQLCLAVDGVLRKFVQLEVHHIYSVIQFPELAYSPNNLICLCSSCHRKVEANLYVLTDEEGNNINLKKFMQEIVKDD